MRVDPSSPKERLAMRNRHWIAVGTMLGAAACAHPASHTMQMQSHMQMPGAGAPSARAYSPEVQAGYDQVRAATASFKNLDSAVAHGYARDVPQCFADSIYGSGGAMGFHHINRAYVDDKLEIAKPEILMYERTRDGKYELTGVEYILPFRYWPKDSVPPKFLGRDLMRENDRNYWYTHMWIWKPSSTGLFADWNPAVKCP
jgi:hypothetical protein